MDLAPPRYDVILDFVLFHDDIFFEHESLALEREEAEKKE
jgi:hypothetical protein